MQFDVVAASAVAANNDDDDRAASDALNGIFVCVYVFETRTAGMWNEKRKMHMLHIRWWDVLIYVITAHWRKRREVSSRHLPHRIVTPIQSLF